MKYKNNIVKEGDKVTFIKDNFTSPLVYSVKRIKNRFYLCDENGYGHRFYSQIKDLENYSKSAGFELIYVPMKKSQEKQQ